jgi:hypothetical protein
LGNLWWKRDIFVSKNAGNNIAIVHKTVNILFPNTQPITPFYVNEKEKNERERERETNET